MAKEKPAAVPAPTVARDPASAPETAQSPTTAQTPERTPVLIKARVLATGVFGVADDVAELPADALAHGVAAGLLDPHPDAVAYAASLK